MSGAIVSDPFTDAQDAVRDSRMEAILGACGVKDFKRLAYHRRVPSSASTTTRDRRVARTTGPAMQAESDAFAPLEASSVLDDLNNDVFGAGARRDRDLRCTFTIGGEQGVAQSRSTVAPVWSTTMATGSGRRDCQSVTGEARVRYHPAVGVRNFLIEGGSGTGKTTVCRELVRRGYHAINGDRELAYQGDPETGEPTDGATHEHHIWDVEKVKALVADRDEALTFLCGGSRNHDKFIDLFDGVFILDVDLDTLNRRLDERADEFGHVGDERELVLRLHRTQEDVPPDGVAIDAAAPVSRVVDDILAQCAR